MPSSGLKTHKNKHGSIEYEIDETLGATTISILYMPSNLTIDATTLHDWLDSFPREDLTELADTIYRELRDTIKPMFLVVQIQRGGFKVNKPPINSPEYDPACFDVKQE